MQAGSVGAGTRDAPPGPDPGGNRLRTASGRRLHGDVAHGADFYPLIPATLPALPSSHTGTRAGSAVGRERPAGRKTVGRSDRPPETGRATARSPAPRGLPPIGRGREMGTKTRLPRSLFNAVLGLGLLSLVFLGSPGCGCGDDDLRPPDDQRPPRCCCDFEWLPPRIANNDDVVLTIENADIALDAVATPTVFTNVSFTVPETFTVCVNEEHPLGNQLELVFRDQVTNEEYSRAMLSYKTRCRPEIQPLSDHHEPHLDGLRRRRAAAVLLRVRVAAGAQHVRRRHDRGGERVGGAQPRHHARRDQRRRSRLDRAHRGVRGRGSPDRRPDGPGDPPGGLRSVDGARAARLRPALRADASSRPRPSRPWTSPPRSAAASRCGAAASSSGCLRSTSWAT